METVYITKTGKTYSYKEAGKYTIPITLDEAEARGLILSKYKWAQKNG